MKLIQTLFLIVIWVIPVFLLLKNYLKMDKEERQEIKDELKTPSILLSGGSISIGFLLFSSGIISTVKLLQHIGAVMVIISWFALSIISWRKRKTSLIVSIGLILLGLIGIVAYIYLN